MAAGGILNQTWESKWKSLLKNVEIRGGRMKSLVIAAWCCIFAEATLLAQSDRGALNGTVVDPVNAVIPGAKILLKNLETGAQYQSTTTDTGNYTIPSLPSGRYELTVEAAGFS